MGEAESGYCQCVGDYFDRTKVYFDGQFGYYVLHANTTPAREDCLDQVKAAHPGDDWVRLPLAQGYYVLKCHYTVCPGVLADLPGIFEEDYKTK